jgi:uncharacterized protein with HEPN domain
MQHEELYLQDIIESISAIEYFLQDIEKDKFLTSDLLQSAVIHKLMIIGEASARLTDELKLRYPNTPLKKIVGLRNITAHAYFTIDWEAVWSTVTNHLEPLRVEVKEILKNEFPDFGLRNNPK